MSEAVRANKRNRMQNWEERKERARAAREGEDRLRKRVAEYKAALPEDPPATFAELPLSERTMLGLERGNYKHLTRIQAEALPHALTGRDVLGAAKTGSGKTLSFLVPLLETLHLQNWDGMSGVGGLVLTPTRELALQIFKVLQVIGYKHPFAAALLTGGRNVEEEKKRLHMMNIIVGTPGRVQHHLGEASSLVIDNLAMLVMDEADRLLDMGFRESITSILDQLPSHGRQTLLFSATQTADVTSLSHVCLKDPKYVAAHAMTVDPTPTRLCQNFLVVELHRKLDALMAFLKRHPNDKVVVFVSTCNQVKFMYLALSKLLRKSRIPTMCLTGKMKQFRRDEVFLTFCRCKSAVLFCTDIAARGLDFPMVHWVVQYDCPESVQTYIHRAGRTARAGARGVNLLFLTPSETPMLSFLHQKRIPLREIAIRPNHMHETKELFVALAVQDLKYEAQKAFMAYLRSLQFASNRHVFKLESIDITSFALSYGLLQVPDLSELTKGRSAKNLPWDVVNYMEKRDSEKEQVTRRERHLKASDMFRTLQQKQRFAAKDDSEAESSDEDLFEKQPRAAPGSEEPQGLTHDERMAGLSKHKKRQLVQSADLRIKDLNLSKRMTFADGEDEDDAKKPTLVGNMLVEEASGDEGFDQAAHARTLRAKVAAATDEDKEQIKRVKKQRQAKKDAQQAGSDSYDDMQSDTDASDDGSDASSAGGDGGLDELLRAARGELYSDESSDDDASYNGAAGIDSDGVSDDGDDEEDSDEEEDEEVPAPRKMKPAAKAKATAAPNRKKRKLE